jgi:hypothetical protein
MCGRRVESEFINDTDDVNETNKTPTACCCVHLFVLDDTHTQAQAAACVYVRIHEQSTLRACNPLIVCIHIEFTPTFPPNPISCCCTLTSAQTAYSNHFCAYIYVVRPAVNNQRPTRADWLVGVALHYGLSRRLSC